MAANIVACWMYLVNREDGGIGKVNFLTSTLYSSNKDVWVVLEEIACMYDTSKYGVIICKNGVKLKVNMTVSHFIKKLKENGL